MISMRRLLVAADRSASADQAALFAGRLAFEAVATVELGDPATHIVSHAANADVDLICVGRRGLGNVGGLLLGSVSHKVSHIAGQTVATVQ
jgi:nucleotide-binding universal stress UspA family protein